VAGLVLLLPRVCTGSDVPHMPKRGRYGLYVMLRSHGQHNTGWLLVAQCRIGTLTCDC
jgi:hypothetical protein